MSHDWSQTLWPQIHSRKPSCSAPVETNGGSIPSLVMARISIWLKSKNLSQVLFIQLHSVTNKISGCYQATSNQRNTLPQTACSSIKAIGLFRAPPPRLRRTCHPETVCRSSFHRFCKHWKHGFGIRIAILQCPDDDCIDHCRHFKSLQIKHHPQQSRYQKLKLIGMEQTLA